MINRGQNRSKLAGSTTAPSSAGNPNFTAVPHVQKRQHATLSDGVTADSSRSASVPVAAPPAPSHASYYNQSTTRSYGTSPYPSFMSFSDTAWLHLEWMGKGIKDAARFDRVLTIIIEDAEIRAHALKSILLNVLSLISVIVFDFLIDPLLDPNHQSFIHRHFGLLYQALWLAPIVGVSLYLNMSWCTVIANRMYSLRYGRKIAAPSSYAGILTQVASSAYRVILIISYLALTFLLSYIPVVGNMLSFVYICWVNSYYCFEYLWIARGMSLAQRVRHEEERWGYYLAFGFPSAIVCMWGSTLANAAIFALFFPSFIITAMYATPVPLQPYSPTQQSPTAVPFDHLSPHGQAPVDLPSPFIPIRLPIFAPVIKMNNGIVRLLTGGIGSGKKRSSPSTPGDGEMVGAEEGSYYQHSKTSSRNYYDRDAGRISAGAIPQSSTGGAPRVRRKKLQ